MNGLFQKSALWCLAHEQLETRAMLSGDGVIWGADARLTISFAPDGTQVADETSSLFAQMNAISPTLDWQREVMRGFQTWARETNGDLGLVSDDGSDFGTPGRLRRDPRFGDIRIGAIPLDDELFAVSVSSKEVIDGTWTGEVLFNHNYLNGSLTGEQPKLDSVFAIALHEAGHVFGLEHNQNPDSPMFEHGIPSSLVPTIDDLDALHAAFGERSPDVYDLPDDDPHESTEEREELGLFRFADGNEGSAPTIAFADISVADDIDQFSFETPDNYSGGATIQLITSEISLLTPSLTISTGSGTQLGVWEALSPGSDLTVRLNNVGPRQEYNIDISGNGDEYRIGGYSLLIWYDAPLNQVDAAAISDFIRYPVRHVESDELEEYFEDGLVFHLHDDDDTNDLPGAEIELETTPGFVTGTRYQVDASIESAQDVDRYSLKAPAKLAANADFGLLTVRSIEAGITPVLSVFDENLNPLNTEVLIHNDEAIVIQIGPLAPDKNYFVQVEAGTYTNGQSGVYELYAQFGVAPTERTLLTENRLDSQHDVDRHRLYVFRPQLFHFSLAVADTASPGVRLRATLTDSSGRVVTSWESASGDTRTLGILLSAGTYGLKVESIGQTAFTNLEYAVKATAVDNPLGPRANNGFQPFYFDEERTQLLAALVFTTVV